MEKVKQFCDMMERNPLIRSAVCLAPSAIAWIICYTWQYPTIYAFAVFVAGVMAFFGWKEKISPYLLRGQKEDREHTTDWYLQQLKNLCDGDEKEVLRILSHFQTEHNNLEIAAEAAYRVKSAFVTSSGNSPSQATSRQ